MKPTLPIFRKPRLTGLRITLALLVALVIDGLQLALGPVGWVVGPGLDLVGMVLTNWLLGFHVLLLPTFVVKLVPLLDDLPTWTACVATVIVLRKREQMLNDSRVYSPNPADLRSAATPRVDCPPVITRRAEENPPLLR